MRKADIKRETSETQIALLLRLDGGTSDIATGVGFFDHMLEQLACHGRFGLSLSCDGDLHVDAHHSVEDSGIALGEAFDEALGKRDGIGRYGDVTVPMDEALVQVCVDFSGRPVLRYGLKMPSATVGGFDTELIEEFFSAFARSARCAVHVRQLDGTNTHHIIEAAFKAFGRALAQASALTGVGIPSTKGTL